MSTAPQPIETQAQLALPVGEEALAYLQLRFDLYEHLLRVRLLGETNEDVADDRLGELASAIVAAEAWALAHNAVLPIEYVRGRAAVSGAAEDILLLCVGVELDPRLGQLIAQFWGNPAEDYVSIALCQALFGADRMTRLRIARLLRPGSPLLDCGLLTLATAHSQRHGRTAHRLVPAPYLAAFLLGDVVDPEPLHEIAETLTPQVSFDQVSVAASVIERLRALTAAATQSAERTLQSGPGGFDVPAGLSVLITGAAGTGRRLLAMAAAREAGRPVIRVHSDRLTLLPPSEAAVVFKLLVELAWFGNRWLLFEDCDRLLAAAPRESYAPLLRSALERTAVTTFFTAQAADALAEPVRQLLYGCVALPQPDRKRLAAIGQIHWPELAKDGEPGFESLVEQRVLSPVAMRNAVALARRLGPSEPQGAPQEALQWAAEGLEAASLGTLATRAQQTRSLSSIIVKPEIKAQLVAIIDTVQVRHRVHHEWGFDRLSARGLGLSCLFHGESGTGKTLAADVIATEVGLPLYQVNMAAIVSKYIGETSKNLSRIFAEAQKSRCVLLFDEADAMFSKRTEVTKSTDRYSNMEINLLLQLIEAYDGITICTTNLKKGIDQAFERRFSFVIHFPEPDKDLRLGIWRHHLPKSAPVEPTLEAALPFIADEFEMSGGNIRQAVLRAAYQAAIAGEPLSEGHLRDAVRHVYKSMGKLVRESGTDW